MNEELNALEAELSGMRPRRLAPRLVDRIAAPLSAPRKRRAWSDRFLLCAIGSGAIAACLIVVLLLCGPRSRDLPAAMAASSPVPRAGDFSLSYARQEDQLASAWK